MTGRGAERILDALEWFAATTTTVSFTDVVKALALPKSSATLLLRLLTERGYIERLADGRFQLVRLPGEKAEGGIAWGALLRIAEQPLRDAVDHAQESGFVAVLSEGRIRYLNKLLPAREIRYDRDITTPRLPHQVASGITLLATEPADALEIYLSGAGLAGDAGEAVRTALAQARNDGYFANLNGVVEGAAGIAAPIIDMQGRAIAAINISGPRDRVIANLDRIVAATTAAARSVSAEIARRKPKPM